MAKTRRRELPSDQAFREKVAHNLDTTQLVEAAAGTGKTTCLIARMVNLLRAGKCRVETLAAVTFTRKAAAELRTRFQLALEVAARDASRDEHGRLTEAVDQVERCFIGTIHSFCARLLRERPVEARLDPGFVELDEATDAQLRREAWREHVSRLIRTDDPILPELERLGLKVSASTHRSPSIATELDELGLEVAELGPAFLRYAEYADVDDWPAPPVPLPDMGPCLRKLTDYLDHMRALPLPDDHGNDKLLPKYELISRMARGLDLNQPAQLMELLEQFRGKPSVVQKMWPGKRAQALDELERWESFVKTHVEPMLLAWREHRYEPVMRAIRPALEVYERLRRERDALNFQDLLSRAVALLRDNPEVRRYFRNRFTHLLVDEFQDTDPIQAELMLLLTADDAEETNWQRCRPVPGALFVVGDPKQSIYRFRRADIQIYNRVRSIIEGVGGEILPLSANFRSERPVIDWVNRCFGQIFPAQADDCSPADRPLDVGRLGQTGVPAAVQPLLVPAELKTNEQVAEFEAEWIARTIRKVLEERWPLPRTDAERRHGLPDHVTPGDFLIVACRKTRLTVYARQLQRYAIPHSVTGGSVLNEVPELGLLHTCLTAVSRSDDPVSLVAVLRGELFGVADTVLYDFRRLGGHFSYYASIPDGLPEPGATALREAFERLKSYALWLRRLPAAAAIERIAADLGLIARSCATEDGDAHAGSLLKAMELLRDSDVHLTVGDYVDALGRLVSQEEVHDGVAVRPPHQPPVRVMNLHQCKGLEAPVVFLVDPAGNVEHEVNVHIDRSADRPRGFLAIYGPQRGQWTKPPLLAQPLGWADLAAREQRFLNAESDRLLYVAATRAGVRLVISQRDGAANVKNPWSRFGSYLASAEPFADPGPVSLDAPPELKIKSTEWRQEIDAIERRWQRVVQPTYAVCAIKDTALAGDPQQRGPKPHGSEAAGAEWGEVLHLLLEAAMARPSADMESQAAAALEGVALPISMLQDAVATVRGVVGSPLWRRAQNAERCLTEVPLALPLSASAANTGLPTVMRGVIDLVFREQAGWVIVDYKSERVGARDIPALVRYYRPQVEAYSRAWEFAVGQPVVERGLFFTHTGEYRSV